MATLPKSVAEEPAVNSPPRIAWVLLGWFAALVALTYLPIWRSLIDQWMTNEDVGHGFFVPLVAGYIAWQKRDEIAALDLKPNYAIGVPILIWGALQCYLGVMGAELFLQRTSIAVTMAGLTALIGGFPLLKVLLFPLILLPFMVPIPSVIYNQITFPLQLFASRVAEMVLTLAGIPVLRDGNILELAEQKLSVVEACSGIRSLLSLTFLSLVYAHFFDSKTWMKWALFIGTVPIAILANAARVSITGFLAEYNSDLAKGFFHSLEGWLIFLVGLAMLVLLHRVINFVYNRIHGKPQSLTA
jgi:exosortase